MENYEGVCWYCTEPSETYVRLPSDPAPFGFFCGYPCALAFIRDEAHPSLKKYVPAKIYLLSKCSEPAPQKWNLVKFGGTMPLSRFRNYQAYKKQLREEKRRDNNVFTQKTDTFHGNGHHYDPAHIVRRLI